MNDLERVIQWACERSRDLGISHEYWNEKKLAKIQRTAVRKLEKILEESYHRGLHDGARNQRAATRFVGKLNQ